MDDHLYPAMRAAPAEHRAPLYTLATRPPDALGRHLARGLALAAALLIGAGLIFWIAANWQDQTRFFRLALIEAALAVCVLAALLLPRARTAALLAASLALGGLLAFVGQTYQTGADAWQLFAVWAALSLPWTLAQRSDLLWTLWVLVAGLGLLFWHGRGDMWMWLERGQPVGNAVSMLAWALIALVPCAVASLRWTRLPQGLGRWSWRMAAALALGNWTAFGLMDLFRDWRFGGWIFWFAVALTVALGGLAWRSRWRDLVCLGLAALTLNVQLWCWLARVLLGDRFETGGFTLLTLLAMLMLGGTATGLMRVQRQWDSGAQPPLTHKEHA